MQRRTEDILMRLSHMAIIESGVGRAMLKRQKAYARKIALDPGLPTRTADATRVSAVEAGEHLANGRILPAAKKYAGAAMHIGPSEALGNARAGMAAHITGRGKKVASAVKTAGKVAMELIV